MLKDIKINRSLRIAKDVVFVALCLVLILRGRWLGLILGLLLGWWYGRDAYYQAKILWQEKHFKPQGGKQEDPKAPSGADDGKITVTDLSQVKEVDFEKE